MIIWSIGSYEQFQIDECFVTHTPSMIMKCTLTHNVILVTMQLLWQTKRKNSVSQQISSFNPG